MQEPAQIDIIILSYAKTERLKQITLDSIESLFASEQENKIQFNVLIIESNKSIQPYQYPQTRTIYPDTKFGYNKYMNIGIRNTNSKYICLCNNDLIYHKNWASEILKAMGNDDTLLSVSPYCPIFHKKEKFDENGGPLEGYFGTLGGWCIFVKREIFDTIGYFDEKLSFWYCDADYCQNLLKHHIKNCLVPTAKVIHLGSESLKTTNNIENQYLTQLPRFYYSYKWVHHSYLKYLAQTGLFRLHMAIHHIRGNK